MTRKQLFEDIKLPSELIEHALTDLKLFCADEKHKYAGGVWLEYDIFNKNTTACLAGAVMFVTFGIVPDAQNIQVHPFQADLFDFPTKHKLSALNHFRTGDVISGCELLGVKVDTLSFDEYFPYAFTLETLYENMERLVTLFKEQNL